MNLLELLKTYSKLENDEGELSEDWESRMDSLGDSINAKIDNSCALLKAWEGNIETIKAEIARLQAAVKRYESKIGTLEKWVCYCIGAEKIDTGLNRAYVKHTEAVEIVDEAIIPIQYVRETTNIVQSPDKTAIKTDLKLGAAIPGAALKKNFSLIIK